jgi:glycosyltransferase involved in cell wall biosynthesis
MKIILATESYYPNIDGGAIAQHRLVQELIKKGHKVYVIAPNYKFINSNENEKGSKIYRSRGVVLPLYMNSKYHFSPFPLFFVKSIIKEINPDIINVCSPYPISISAVLYAKKFNTPIVGSIHILPENMLSPFIGRKYYNFLRKNSWKYLINFYNFVDHATIPTKTGAKMYIKRGLKTDLIPISNGVDTDLFNPRNNGKYLRDKFDLPDKKLVLYTGRICAEKNLDVLIKSIPSVIEKIDCHFLFCGSGGTYKEKMKKLVEKLGVSDYTTFIDFLDWEDYPNIYNIADVFVMPAEAELQSIVTMEAIASGLPVIVVNNGAVPELANKNNGFLFKPKNFHDLSSSIIRILSNDQLRKKMGKNSLLLAKKHSMNYVAEQFEKVYDKTISLYKN